MLLVLCLFTSVYLCMQTPSAVLQPQPVDGPDKAARGSIAFPPFLWMPNSPAGTTQQGLPRAGSHGTESASVELRSVNQLHGLASPPQKAVSGSQVPASQAGASLQWQHPSSKDAAAAGSANLRVACILRIRPTGNSSHPRPHNQHRKVHLPCGNMHPVWTMLRISSTSVLVMAAFPTHRQLWAG